ncbi:MAG: NAD(P)-dependent oxidoreductase, partial [Candidatus Rokubacteria bacterium]|nr:NAD(P)-dependent oxidoreductase [Candidatus Rokubacteria bacterium]
MATVGLVGLGLLGGAVASRLHAGGHKVVGFDVLPEKIRELVALGGAGAASAADVARASEAVCTLLPSLASVEEAILGPHGILAAGRSRQTILQMSTISPALTLRLAREVDGRGGVFVDAPVSGTSAMVARGEGVILLGGDQAVCERWRAVLEAIVPRVVHVGAAGQAMVVKLVANLLVALNTVAAAEALLMAERAGLDPARVLEILAGGAGTSRMLDVRGPMIVRREFPAQMKLELFMKDLALITETGEEVGAPLPLTHVARQLYGAAQAAGHGGEDLAVVVTALERLSDPSVRARTRFAGPRPAQSFRGGGFGRGGDPGVHAGGVGGPGWPPSE